MLIPHEDRVDERQQWLAALLQPITIAGVTLANRAMMSALTLQYGGDGLITDRHLAFYQERARGEVGLLFSEQLDASPLSESPFSHSLHAYDPRQVGAFRRIAEILRPYGTKFFAQLFSAGAAATGRNGRVPRAPSDVPAPGCETPCPLSVPEIEQLAHDYAIAARNVSDGLLDGVEIHGAHGWLAGQFLSPYYNRRTDAYGGSVENRCRFVIEIATAIRREVGPDFPLGIAMTYDELLGDRGITPSDTLAQLHVLNRSGLFDFYDLSIGSSHQQHHTIASMAVPEGYALPFAAQAKALIGNSAAIFVTGRVTDPYMAGRAVAEQQADVVGMTRALLADPHLVKKTRLGQRVTHCIGANHCVARALADEPVGCVLNPATGREADGRDPPQSRTRRAIVVAGAGPSGLRFALTAARAGHSVTVFEREEYAGGHLSLLSRLPTRQPWATAVRDMVQALESAGGMLRLDTEVTAAMLIGQPADTVVVATGSRWAVPAQADPDGTGTSAPQSLPLDRAIDLATGQQLAVFGRHSMIVDSSGTYAPLGLADLLLASGVRVTFVTENTVIGHVAFGELELQHVLPRLERCGMRIVIGHRVAHAGRSVAMLEPVIGGSAQVIADVDTVVYSSLRVPSNELWLQIRDRRPGIYCIGDAASPRTTAAVVYEGEELARSF